jgi:GNAT superfamily N-acetyltransferase
MVIKEISIDEALPIRQKAMWPDESMDFVKVEGDEKAVHLGLLLDRKLISVVSIFGTGEVVQFRKFGTLPDYQKRGFGSKLLVYLIGFLKERSVKKIWCNARTERVDFYERFGFTATTKTFFKTGKEYVIMEMEL